MPGFRSGNPLHILIAILAYGVFSIFALAVGLASFSSFSNFVVGATVLLGPVGCYLFAFDLFNIRTRCTLVERFRHTKQYPFYCVCVMLSWLLLCFFVMLFSMSKMDESKWIALVQALNPSAVVNGTSMEEPPEGVLFIMTADSLAGVLPTIRSRCISFAVAPVSPEACARYCTARGVEKKDAALYSELFDGHIGTVLAAARDEDRRALVEQALTLAKAAQARDSYAAAVLLAGYEKDKAGATALLADFRAAVAAGVQGSKHSPVQGETARKALGLADTAIWHLSTQGNPKITLSVLAAKFRTL